MNKKTKLLIVSANPKNTSRLRLDEEVREIEEGLRRSVSWEQFVVKSTWALRPIDLRRALLDEQPNVVHFSGHGETKGLILENNIGEAIIVPADALEGLFNLFSANLECVLLNACYSEAQATAIAKKIPHVIGMQEEITDEGAREFSIGFYDALGAGRSIQEAFDFGCNAIQFLGYTNSCLPVLLSKSTTQDCIQNTSQSIHQYRFRAECSADVDELRCLLGMKVEKITITSSPPFPDVEVDLKVESSLNALRDVMRTVTDGHVMVETVAHHDEYTGERKYGL